MQQTRSFHHPRLTPKKRKPADLKWWVLQCFFPLFNKISLPNDYLPPFLIRRLRLRLPPGGAAFAAQAEAETGKPKRTGRSEGYGAGRWEGLVELFFATPDPVLVFYNFAIIWVRPIRLMFLFHQSTLHMLVITQLERPCIYHAYHKARSAHVGN